ncbi:MAG: hypothetical protein Q7J84_02015, partial [Sulfuricaulis sp.]|nr:hypothetical protein [Sulfuricaulis sp.]
VPSGGSRCSLATVKAAAAMIRRFSISGGKKSMPDEQIPALVAEAPQTVEAPAEGTIPEAPAPVTAAAAPSTKPDISSLLNDAETRKLLFAHPDMAKELDHRVKSTRKADIDREVEARLAAVESARTQRDIESELAAFVKEYPDHPLAQKVKPVMDATSAQQREIAMANDISRQAGKAWKDRLVMELADFNELTEEDKKYLDPFDVPRFPSNGAFVKEWVNRAAKNLVEKELAKRLPSEVEARVQERLGELRGTERGPATLPNGSGSYDDAAFLKLYAAGDSNDHKRARQLTGV